MKAGEQRNVDDKVGEILIVRCMPALSGSSVTKEPAATNSPEV